MMTGLSMEVLAEVSPWANKNYTMLFFLIAALLFIGLMLLRSYRNPRRKEDETEISLSDKTINQKLRKITALSTSRLTRSHSGKQATEPESDSVKSLAGRLGI
jgi:hypothetical protein